MANRTTCFGWMSRPAQRAKLDKRGITTGCLTVETLEVRLCMDAAGILEDRQLLAPQAGVQLAALVAGPRTAAEVPRVTLSGPAKPVGRGVDAVFNVSLSTVPGEGKTVSVRYSTFDGLARAGRQYVATSGLLTFTGAETTKAIYVPTIAGAQSFNAKADRFGLKLSAPAGVKLVSSTAYATIAPSVRGLGISSTTVVEGNEGTKTATFVVTLGKPVSKTVTVDYTTVDGTATVENNDYISTSGSLTFAPGETRKTITVAVNGDSEPEIDETFKVVLSNATNVDLQLPVGVATIRTDDGVPEIVHAFQFTLDYSTTIYGPVPEPVRKAAEWAAARWSEVIIGDLPDVNDPDLGLIDDFRMTVGMGLLDTLAADNQPNGTLANAAPLEYRKDAGKLPWLGITGVDPADANRPELRGILLHEFGHALGFTPGAEVFKRFVSGNGFAGPQATQAYREIFSNTATFVPLETSGGAGTAGAHWSEAVFGTELMTGYVNPVMQLSRLTVGAKADLGYEVNYAAADVFMPPPAGIQAAARAVLGGAVASGVQAQAVPSTEAKPYGVTLRATVVPERPQAKDMAAAAVKIATGQTAIVNRTYKQAGLVPRVTAQPSASIQAAFASWHGVGVTARAR